MIIFCRSNSWWRSKLFILCSYDERFWFTTTWT